MFDPFKDFDTAGYLRNFAAEKDLDIVKAAEHELFRANLPEVVHHLATLTQITYADFCQVHKILFQGLYPWAGQDRSLTAPDSAVHKGETLFAHPADVRRAVEHALRLGRDATTQRERPGEVMGLLAYAHPFLDGNGRTLLLVHSELCRRAGFSILWHRTAKSDYLLALTQEIANPQFGVLDRYLQAFVGPPQSEQAWVDTVAALPGLDGAGQLDEVHGSFSDPQVSAQYRQFERHRGYEIKG